MNNRRKFIVDQSFCCFRQPISVWRKKVAKILKWVWIKCFRRSFSLQSETEMDESSPELLEKRERRGRESDLLLLFLLLLLPRHPRWPAGASWCVWRRRCSIRRYEVETGDGLVWFWSESFSGLTDASCQSAHAPPCSCCFMLFLPFTLFLTLFKILLWNKVFQANFGRLKLICHFLTFSLLGKTSANIHGNHWLEWEYFGFW